MRPSYSVRIWLCILICTSSFEGVGLSARADAILPTGFEERLAVSGLQDPATMAFSPDGRLFIAERIQGQLRVAVRDADTGLWTLLSTPFATFNVPTDGNGTPLRHRSSGVRGFAFDPEFADNGHIYVFYMNDAPRHNRVVRITASSTDPNVASGGETVLLEMPFSSTSSSGSHNGGAVMPGTDGYLYVTTGDGWNGGDDVQSLSTFTGKVYRIALDGSIPMDNPFFNQATGELRAIFALGLRNPFSMSRHPASGQIYINDVAGNGKTAIYKLEPGANYGHDGYDGIGVQTSAWAYSTTGSSGDRVISGGAWYPVECGPFPGEFLGSYVVSHYGSNGSSSAKISRLVSDTDSTIQAFASNIGAVTNLKPLYVRVGPEGHIYYLASDYEASDGRVYEIRPIGSTSTDDNQNFIPDACEVAIGDMNCDGSVDGRDLTAFAIALSSPAEFVAAYPGCELANGDFSGDGNVTLTDVGGFVDTLLE